jgi:hypothetical protein
MALKMKSISAITEHLQIATSLKMLPTEYKEIEEANRVLSLLVEEEKAEKELKAALVKNDENTLRLAISKAQSLGIVSVTLESAIKAVSKIGAQSEKRDRLIQVMNDKGVTADTLRSVIKEVEAFEGSASLMGDIKSAKVKLDRLEQEESISMKLNHALASNNFVVLEVEFANAKKLNLTGGKLEGLLSSVSSVLSNKTANEKAKRAIMLALASKVR